MANLARAVVLVVSMTLTIGAVGSVEPQGSPWEAGYVPNVLPTPQDCHTTHSYDLIKDTQVLVTYVGRHDKEGCQVEAARVFTIAEIENRSDHAERASAADR